MFLRAIRLGLAISFWLLAAGCAHRAAQPASLPAPTPAPSPTAAVPISPSSAPELTYVFEKGTVTVVSARTPYDDAPEIREAFLHWFVDGFEAGLNGSHIMAEWQHNAVGRAAQQGYECGHEQGERFRNARPSAPVRETVPILPF
jgi:hypothetical protein